MNFHVASGGEDSTLYLISKHGCLRFISHQQLRSMEMGPQLKVSSHRLVKPGINIAIPGLQGEQFIHYDKAAFQACVDAVMFKLSQQNH